METSPIPVVHSVVHPYIDDEYTCRICLEPGERKEFIAPCSCKGSSKWVHRNCLDRWRSTREDVAFSKCTECLKNYVLISRVDDSFQPKLMRRLKFLFYVFRDFSFAFLLIQAVIIGLSSFVYLTDSKSSILLKYFHSEKHAQFFYYFSGVIIFLATLGMFYSCGLSNVDSNGRTFCGSCGGCGDCVGMNPFCYYDTMDCAGECAVLQ